jgi:DNA repair protein RadC
MREQIFLVAQPAVTDPTPSPNDAQLTIRLAQAADVLDMPLLDHLIVGAACRYFSFREAGMLAARITDGVRA